MKKQKDVADDIRIMRERSGLRQIDCDHLLGAAKGRISHIENANRIPTVLEIATLSIILGKPMETFLSALLDEVVDSLIKRLRTMPPAPRSLPGTYNRTDTLQVLARRLEILSTSKHDGA